MVSEWITCLDKRPEHRTGEDLDIIYSRLKEVKAFERFHPNVLQQICQLGYYQDLDKDVVLFRQGDIGTNWYAVLCGSVNVDVSDTGRPEDAVTICTLGPGTTFGESILYDTPRHATIITGEFSELLRVQKMDFRKIWENNKEYMESIISVYNNINQDKLSESDDSVPGKLEDGSERHTQVLRSRSSESNNSIHPAMPLTKVPGEKLAKAGQVVRSVITTRSPYLIKDRKLHQKTHRRCSVGSEMIDWLVATSSLVHSRSQAVGMWQALLEEGVIYHVTHEHQFKDSYLFYRFRENLPSDSVIEKADNHEDNADKQLQDVLAHLNKIGPDAMFRVCLRKHPSERTTEDLDLIYEELLHINALAHLSTTVKRELALVMKFESHEEAGTMLFSQGDEGTSWYITLKGSINVVIYGKGVVCQLHEGDDFGKLALVNDAPRAATIETCEANCHFLRVDKEDFNRILRDVEANTVRLKEHGKDVLVLEKMTRRSSDVSQQSRTIKQQKYIVKAGTPEKMLEHLLETRMDSGGDGRDHFVEDFLITYPVFMSEEDLCALLLAHCHGDSSNNSQDWYEENIEHYQARKKRVVQLVLVWINLAKHSILQGDITNAFLDELKDAIRDANLDEELTTLHKMLMEMKSRFQNSECPSSPKINPLMRRAGQSSSARRFALSDIMELTRNAQYRSIVAEDENIFKVYCADHTYTTVRLPYDAPAATVVQTAAERLLLGDDCVLCEVRSSGEKLVLDDDEISVTSGLSVNGKLFIVPGEHIDSLTPLPEQEGPTSSTASQLEMWNSRDIAYQITSYDHELFSAINLYEFIYHIFGRSKFGRITSNLDIFLNRFNEMQFWVSTEICLTSGLSKKLQLLKKFIKVAAYCKDYQNWFSFFAIIMGMNNIAASRLTQMWERLPGKYRNMKKEFDSFLDPSRNHRIYRLSVAKMDPPIIPFMPLLIKDMTFSNEGNKTYVDELVNFEKMRLIASTIRNIQRCREPAFAMEPPQMLKNIHEIRNYIRDLYVIDNQRTLTQLSHRCEPRRS